MWGISRKDSSPCNVVPPLFIKYLDYLVRDGQLYYMKRNSISPSVMIPDSAYSWGWDNAGNYGFVWRGPNAYEGNLPSDLAGIFPLWDIIWSFAYRYERHLVAEQNWNATQREYFYILPDRFLELEEIRELCEQNLWVEAASLYEVKKKIWCD